MEADEPNEPNKPLTFDGEPPPEMNEVTDLRMLRDWAEAHSYTMPFAGFLRYLFESHDGFFLGYEKRGREIEKLKARIAELESRKEGHP